MYYRVISSLPWHIVYLLRLQLNDEWSGDLHSRWRCLTSRLSNAHHMMFFFFCRNVPICGISDETALLFPVETTTHQFHHRMEDSLYFPVRVVKLVVEDRWQSLLTSQYLGFFRAFRKWSFAFGFTDLLSCQFLSAIVKLCVSIKLNIRVDWQNNLYLCCKEVFCYRVIFTRTAR